MFEKIRKLLKSESAEDIRAALAELDPAPLLADLERARAQRTEALLGGTDEKVAIAEKELAAARIAVERADVARNELERKLSAAEAAEFDREFLAKRASADASAEAVLETVRKRVVPAAKVIAEALNQMEESDRLLSEVQVALHANLTLDNAAGRSAPLVPAARRIASADLLPGWAAAMFERHSRLV